MNAAFGLRFAPVFFAAAFLGAFFFVAFFLVAIQSSGVRRFAPSMIQPTGYGESCNKCATRRAGAAPPPPRPLRPARPAPRTAGSTPRSPRRSAGSRLRPRRRGYRSAPRNRGRALRAPSSAEDTSEAVVGVALATEPAAGLT